MYDVVGKIWAFFLAIIIFFIMTLTLYAQKQDVVVQNYVDSAVEEFVDTARVTGYITRSSYDALITKLDATKNVYNIIITHYEAKTNLVNAGGSLPSYENNFNVYTKDDILRALESQNSAVASPKYMMNKGDFLRVELKNTTPTMARKLMGLFYGGSSGDGQIRSSYGGYIGYDS